MDDLGQLIIFFMCAAIFGMGVSFLFGELKAAHRIEVGEVIYIIQGDEIKLSSDEFLPIGRTNRENVKKTILRYMR